MRRTRRTANRTAFIWAMAFCIAGNIAGRSGAQEEATTMPATIDINGSGAWTWFNDPRAIVVGDLLIVGSVDADGYSRVDVLDLKTLRPVPGGGTRLSTLVQKDDHNNPAFLDLGGGRVLAAYSRHGTDKFWCSRIGTVDGAVGTIDWADEVRHDVGAGSTYCNLFKLGDEDGRVYNFLRGLNFNPNVTTSDTLGQTWAGPSILFKVGPGNVRPYVKYAGDGEQRVDFLYTDGHPRDVRTSIFHAYYQDGQLHRSDGEAVAPMPGVDHPAIDPEAGTKIYDGSKRRAWVWDIAATPDGLAAVFIVSADDDKGEDLRYHYARWDESAKRWNQREFAHAGPHLYVPENHYAGGATLDPKHAGVVYLSTNRHPQTGEPDPTGHFQIWRATTVDGGETWRFEKLTDTPDADNLRPYALREHPLETCVLWFRGRYDTYQKYDTRVVGLLER